MEIVLNGIQLINAITKPHSLVIPSLHETTFNQNECKRGISNKLKSEIPRLLSLYKREYQTNRLRHDKTPVNRGLVLTPNSKLPTPNYRLLTLNPSLIFFL